MCPLLSQMSQLEEDSRGHGVGLGGMKNEVNVAASRGGRK